MTSHLYDSNDQIADFSNLISDFTVCKMYVRIWYTEIIFKISFKTHFIITISA